MYHNEDFRINVIPLINRAWKKIYPAVYADARQRGVSLPRVIPVKSIIEDGKSVPARYNRRTETIEVSTSHLRSFIIDLLRKEGVDAYFYAVDALAMILAHEVYHHFQNKEGLYEELKRLLHTEEFVPRYVQAELDADYYAIDLAKSSRINVDYDEVKYYWEKLKEYK